jgi:hypothetical protein
MTRYDHQEIAMTKQLALITFDAEFQTGEHSIKISVTKAKRRSRQRQRIFDFEPELTEELGKLRPTCRSQCRQAVRPCPWVACKYHLYGEFDDDGIWHCNHPGKEPWELENTCALDLADEGPLSTEQIGAAIGVGAERARQIVVEGLQALREVFDTLENLAQRRQR